MQKRRQLSDRVVSNVYDIPGNLLHPSVRNQTYELLSQVNNAKGMIDQHLRNIHWNVSKNAQETIAYVQQMQKKSAAASKRKPKNVTANPSEKENSLAGLMEVWKMLRVPVPVTKGKNLLGNIKEVKTQQ